MLVGAQLRGADLAIRPGETIELAYQAMNTEGRQSRGAFDVITLDFTADSRASVSAAGSGSSIEAPMHRPKPPLHRPA